MHARIVCIRQALLFGVGLCLLSSLSLSGNAPISGRAAVTQKGSPVQYYSDNWDSMRTFRLTRPLSTPLKIYIDTPSHLYKSSFSSYITQSLNAWSRALNGRLSYRLVSSRSSADITVDWTPRFSDPYIAGMTTYGIGYAKLQIRVSGIPDKDIKANIMHEFGHALGIAGHSLYPDDIMVASRRWRRGDNSYEPMLSQRDVRAIQLLYSRGWRQGEDLYSASAQRANPLASANGLPETESGADDTMDFHAISTATPAVRTVAHSPFFSRIARLIRGKHRQGETY